MDLKRLNLEAAAALEGGDLIRADGLIGQMNAARPGHPLVLYLRGILRIRQGRHTEALALLEQAHKAVPGQVTVLLHMGNALQALQRFEEAVEIYDRALALKPDFSDALNNRGNALSALNRFDAALASLDAALAIAPPDADSWYNRGTLLQTMGRPQEAIACFDRALALRPDHAETYSNKGSALIDQGEHAEALSCIAQALALQPDSARFHMNRASALFQMEAYGEALAEYERVRALDPDFPKLFGRIALTALHEPAWERMDAIATEIPARVAAGEEGIDPWTLISYGANNELLQQCARNVMRAALPDPLPPRWKGEAYGHDRVRLAYVSADFRTHTVAFQLAELLERHDRSRFEVIGISSGRDDGSAVRARIRAACDQFHDVAGMTDRALAQKLRGLEVDIAVDLSGHTWGTRIGAFEDRPAPVQAAWLGYPGTTGAREMDFIIGDAIVTPPEHQAFYDEKIMPLPGCFFPLDTGRAIGQPPTREEAGLPREGFVFCCFNRNWKILPPVLDSWLRLLKTVPDSVLWLRASTPESDTVLKRYAQEKSVDESRLIFAERAPLETHLARHALADLFLDTLPYGAHATACDALWAGLPVLTRLGETFAGRVGASLVTAVGLPELVTHTAQEYEATAVALAQDPARLKVLRDRLAENRIAAFDMTAFARRLEAAYHTMLGSKR